jgi:hypothetical protein
MPNCCVYSIPFKIEALDYTCPAVLFAAETEEQIVVNQMFFPHVLVQ